VRRAPAPLLPRSLTVSASVVLPVNPPLETKRRPLSAALMSGSVPLNVIVLSALPSPTVKTSPATVASVSVPPLTLRVTWTEALPASMSLITTGLPVALEKTSVEPWLTDCAAGAATAGASLTALTLSVMLLTPEESAPPLPVLPPSLIDTPRVTSAVSSGAVV
jgi:hypothetical protein